MQKNIIKKIDDYNFLFFLISILFLNIGIALSYFLIFCFFLYSLKFKSIQLDKEDKITLLIFVYFSFNFIFLFELKNININFVIKQILYLKFFLLFFYLNFRFKSLNLRLISDSFIKVFYIVCILIILVYIERFFSFNIFNREMLYGRTYGPYKELIVGSLILYVGYHGFLQLLLNNKIKSPFFKKLFFVSLFNFYFFSIFCTGERMNFLLTILIILLMLLFIKSKRIIILCSSFVLLILIYFTFTYNLSLKKKYTSLFKMVNISKLESQNIYSSDKILNNDENKKQEKKKISEKKITNLYLVHWLTAYELWKEKPIFGWGTKSFRYKCNDLEDITYFVEEGRCNTHPHNIYLEILSETGIVGLLMISFFLIYNLKNIKIELINAYRISYNKEILILLLSLTFIFLSLIWPLKTSGRLFSNFYGTIFWFNIFCLINLLKNIKKFKNEK